MLLESKKIFVELSYDLVELVLYFGTSTFNVNPIVFELKIIVWKPKYCFWAL
jgi:hypothetical protein